MNEQIRVLQAIKQARQNNEKVALATIIRVTGSAYRREGTKAVIDKAGVVNGILSGGCLEPDVAEVAKQVLADGKAQVKRYVLDEDLVWGLGLGCPGTVEVYLEPIPLSTDDGNGKKDHENGDNENNMHGDIDPLSAWMDCLFQKQSGVLCTIMGDVPEYSLVTGDRLFVSAEGKTAASERFCAKTAWIDALIQTASEKLAEPFARSHLQILQLPSGVELPVFFDIHVPQPDLIVFGAGHDAIPLVTMSTALGIETTVVDPRPAYNTPERFPQARCLLAGHQEYSQHVAISPRSYVVVMNHHLERDQAAIAFALQSPAPYIGILGPRTRRDRILEALETEGGSLSKEQRERLHGPIGLDIGADSAEEIAVSIVAELLAVRNGHEGGFLREREHIHRLSAAAKAPTLSLPEHPISACHLE